MAFKKVAEISIDKLEDRKTVTAILHANGYTVEKCGQKIKWTVGEEEQSRLVTVNTPDIEYTVLAKRIDDTMESTMQTWKNMESQLENPERPKPDQDRQPGHTIIQ